MSAIIGIAALGSFTFHYVSINTSMAAQILMKYITFTFHYVSTNTAHYRENGWMKSDFTFHYVSINTVLLTHINSLA